MTDENILSKLGSELKPYEGTDPLPQDLGKDSKEAFKQIVRARRSIRLFDGEKIPDEVMDSIFSDVTLSPTSSNLQPWQFYWIRDTDKKKRAAEACLGQPAATSASELIACVARPDLWDKNRKALIAMMTENGSRDLPKPVASYYKKLIPKVMKTDFIGINNFARRLLFTITGWKQPMVRVPVNRGDHRIWAHNQVCLGAQTLMLSATAHGYDSCPMGGFDEYRVKKILGLPKGAEVTMMMALGKRKPEGLYGPRLRLPQEDVILKV